MTHVSAQRQLPVLPDNCPPGFYVPDDLSGDNPSIWYVNTTLSNCAVGCIIPFFSDDEWDTLETTYTLSLSLGFVTVTLLLITWIADTRKNSQFVVIIFASVSFFQTIAHIILQSIPRQERFCSDETKVISADDGWTVCNVHSFIEVYCSLVICMCWMFQAVGVYRKVILEIKFSPKYKNFLLAFILLSPLASLAGLAKMEGYGYAWGASMCQINVEAYQSGYGVLLVTFPVFVFSLIGMFCMLRVIARILALLFERQRMMARVAVEQAKEAEQLGNGEGSPAVVSRPTKQLMKFSPSRPVDAANGAEVNVSALINGRYSGISTGNVAEEDRGASVAAPHGSDAEVGALTAAGRDKGNTDADDSAGNRSQRSITPTRGDGQRQPDTVRWAEIWDMIVFLRTPIAFTVFFGLLYSTVIIYTMSVAVDSDRRIESATEWAQCVLINYDGDASNKSWVPACGVRPKVMLPFSTRLFTTFTFSGSSLFCALIHAPEMYSSWKAFYVANMAQRVESIARHVSNILRFKGNSVGVNILPPSAAHNGGSVGQGNGESHVSSFIVVEHSDDVFGGCRTGDGAEQSRTPRFESNYQDIVAHDTGHVANASSFNPGPRFLSNSSLSAGSRQASGAMSKQTSQGAGGDVVSHQVAGSAD